MNHDTAAKTLAAQYAQWIDDRNFERLREIICDDFSQCGPGFSSNSADEFLIQLQVLNSYHATFHMIGNQLGCWEGGLYRGETYCVASHLYEKSGQEFKLDMGIRYQDVIVQTPSAYRYQSRDLKVIWTQDSPTGESLRTT